MAQYGVDQAMDAATGDAARAQGDAKAAKADAQAAEHERRASQTSHSNH